MLRSLLCFGLLRGCVLASAVVVPHTQFEQAPLIPAASSTGRQLTGKFLHITDIHPDHFYLLGSDPDQSCHRGNGHAGPLGAEKTDCDSAISHVNATFAWIRDNLADDIDFVVWTGDSARHDNDDEIPRNKSQVIGQNEFLLQKFREVWGVEHGDQGPAEEFKIPIVPTLGNNDILPHNIFSPGPNQWTHEYLSMWRRLIPEEQRHSFTRGGWFYVEVIPNKLAVFSLNTLYFFASNAAVDGCDDTAEPGYEQFQWLRIQLQLLRERGVKAIMTGHVPPARNEQKEMWTESCWMKYALWLRQYRDVVVGSLWGHMNVEHFFLMDLDEVVWDVGSRGLLGSEDEEVEGNLTTFNDYLRMTRVQDIDEEDTSSPGRSLPSRDTPLSIQVNAPDYLNALRQQFSSLPNTPVKPSATKQKKKRKDQPTPEECYHNAIGGEHAERFAVNFVSASIVPNFFPTLRVFRYSLEGLEGLEGLEAEDSKLEGGLDGAADEVAEVAEVGKVGSVVDVERAAWNDIDALVQLDETETSTTTNHRKHKKKKKRKKGKHKKKPKFPVPLPPSHDARPGPAYAQQSLSLLGYIQYYANLTRIQRISPLHEGANERYEVEYDTMIEGDAYDWAVKDGDMHSGITVRNVLETASRIGEYAPGRRNYAVVEDAADGAEHKGERVESDEEDVDEMEERGVEAKRYRKKKGKRKKKRSKDAEKAWFSFVRRALVGTVNADEVRRDYG